MEQSIITTSLEERCINAIRFLAVDAVQKANSGHPGAPLGAAPLAFALWDRFLKHNPRDPKWADRDRFVLSAGHASALLYSLLHLTGYDLPLEELKQFRQWGSRTPGHPEYGLAPGVEATTGPLGQGFTNGVGMAIAERWLASRYNRPGHELINHYTYALVSDGDLMEGVSSEAASLAGHLKLGKLIYLYDSNRISIEGSTELAFTEDVKGRFQAYGWQAIGPIDGLSTAQVAQAIQEAQNDKERPSLIICRTTIGYGSPHKAGTAAVHGEPLGEEEVALTRKALGWEYPPFTVPEDVLAYLRRAVERGQTWQSEWQARLEAYRKAYPEEAHQLEAGLAGELPPGWDSELASLFPEPKPMATREASGEVLNALAKKVKNLIGGSADLAPSTKTLIKNGGDFSAKDYSARNFHFGVREHAMGAVANGLALHGGVIPYTATFLIFYDYMRPPVRLAALSGLGVIFIFTHDSVGLGEDGPTHQPIEHLPGLRAVPHLVTIRPADAYETVEAWKVAIKRRRAPTALLLTRQKVPALDRRQELAPASGLQKGGYVLWQASPQPQIILMGTGSEVAIALEAGRELQKRGIAARVVSLPSWELFEAQPEEYRRQVLPPSITPRIAIEAASPLGWERYVGTEGVVLGINRFGASAPGEVIYKGLGLTKEHLVEESVKLVGERG